MMMSKAEVCTALKSIKKYVDQQACVLSESDAIVLEMDFADVESALGTLERFINESPELSEF